MNCYSVSPHDFCLATVFPHMILFNCLYRIYFFYTELVENLALQFFFKHRWLLQCFPTWFFLLWFFSKFSLSIFLFLILSWLKITTVDFLMKRYRLLQFFPARFFSFRFFVIFFKIFFVDFILLILSCWKLQLYISSQNTIDCYSVFLNDFNIELIENLALTFPTCFFYFLFAFFFLPNLSSFSFHFFCVVFFKIVFVDFIFLMLSWLRI